MSTKSGLKKQFKTNKQAEREGIWVELPEAANADGTIPAFLIARVDTFNVEHSAETERLSAKYDGRKMTREQSIEVTRKAFIKCGVRNWRNIQNDEGHEISFSTQNAFELLEDEEMNDLYLKLVVIGNDANKYKDGLEIDAKN